MFLLFDFILFTIAEVQAKRNKTLKVIIRLHIFL